RDKGNHIITSRIEHPAILEVCESLEKKGMEVTYLPVDGQGLVSVSAVEAAVTARTILITIMHANNEVGTIQPLEEISRIAKKQHIVFHTDAAQSMGKIPVKVNSLGVDLLSIAGHKVYAPKGIGALYVRNEPAVTPKPIIHGGGHENGLRPGTLNTPGIIGLAKACEIYLETAPAERVRLKTLADRLYDGIKTNIPDVSLNGHPEKRMTHILNLRFDDLKAADLMKAMPELAISSGSACSSAENAASYVILAMGIPENIACGSIRYSLGRFTTQEHIDFAIKTTTNAVRSLRKQALTIE
ncbi:MAG: cysteine desulfurase, partial [Anaerohalosphaera sp.]|nr:cysteine desulfurase [Anaerohalosphaera sp.]